MEKIPFDVNEIIAEKLSESADMRRVRLEGAIRDAVAVHRANLDSFAPQIPPAHGIDPVIDNGRETIWRLDSELLRP